MNHSQALLFGVLISIIWMAGLFRWENDISTNKMLPLPPNTSGQIAINYPDHDLYERMRLGNYYARAKIWELRINEQINTNPLVNHARVDRWPDDHLFYVEVDSFFEGRWIAVHVSHVELDSLYTIAVERWSN